MSASISQFSDEKLLPTLAALSHRQHMVSILPGICLRTIRPAMVPTLWEMIAMDMTATICAKGMSASARYPMPEITVSGSPLSSCCSRTHYYVSGMQLG